LNTGAKIPAVGLGTWQSGPHEVEKAVEVALRKGYRHIDTALAYGNEAEVGRGIKNSGVPREEIWLTTKLDNTWRKYSVPALNILRMLSLARPPCRGWNQLIFEVSWYRLC
jgi:diketogulonate reductase-like aldo/keto reductase